MIPLESYPVESWRPNQRDGAELICAAAASGQQIRVGLEAPCGSGKSLMALRAAFSGHCPPCNILSTTRAHLRQYEETLAEHYPQLEGKPGGWVVLRGRSAYACCRGEIRKHKKERGVKASGLFEADTSPVSEWVEPIRECPKFKDQCVDGVFCTHANDQCPLGDECQYLQAIKASLSAQVVLQCTIGFLYRRKYWAQGGDTRGEAQAGISAVKKPNQSRHPNCKKHTWVGDSLVCKLCGHRGGEARQALVSRDLIILDEAHEYLRVRREFELERLPFWPSMLTESFQAKLLAARTKGNYKCSYVLLEPGSALREECTREIVRLLQPAELEKLKPSRKLSDSEWAESREKFAEKLRARLVLLRTDPEEQYPRVVSLQFNDFAQRGAATCEIVGEPLFAGVKEPLARCEIFMSATLNCVARLLKIAPEHVRSYPEIFDWAEAVTLNPLNDPDPDSRANRPLGPEQLEAIYNVPGRPLTLVLYMSKAHANAAVKGWGMKAQNLLIQSGESELSELIEKARAWQEDGGEDCNPAPMLVCYGGWVGTDLPGEKWLCVGSAPKSPVCPHHEARQLRRYIRSAWDDFEKLALDRTQLAQGLGRALRSKDDTCTLIWTDTQAFRDLGLNRETGRIDA